MTPEQLADLISLMLFGRTLAYLDSCGTLSAERQRHDARVLAAEIHERVYG